MVVTGLGCEEKKGWLAAWFDALPETLRDSATGEALQAIVELDLDERTAAVPSRGYGRDKINASGTLDRRPPSAKNTRAR
jgi:Resolvase, N terminal domain